MLKHFRLRDLYDNDNEITQYQIKDEFLSYTLFTIIWLEKGAYFQYAWKKLKYCLKKKKKKRKGAQFNDMQSN